MPISSHCDMLHGDAAPGNVGFAVKNARCADDMLVGNIFFINHQNLWVIEWLSI
jgi:hypothetical protein